jgi:lipoate-protein ligase B
VDPSSGSARLPQADYVGYVRRLEEVLILALARLGVSARPVPGMTGVWVEQAKIAAIGVKVDARGVTRHGFALNVNPDMSYWEGIIGCGLVGYPVTSLAALLGVVPPMQHVADEVVDAFARVFLYDIDEIAK